MAYDSKLEVDRAHQDTAEKETKTFSQWEIAWRRFRRHRLGNLAVLVLGILYLTALFAPFVTPYNHQTRHRGYAYVPPQRIRFVDSEGRFHIRPFVYGIRSELDRETFTRSFVPDPTEKYALQFLVRGDPYSLFGVVNSDLRLFGVEEGGKVFVFGTDRLGRDLLSRIIVGARISLTVGLVGVLLMMTLGTFFGIVSGYYRGLVDTVIQRIVELLLSFPDIPLWMALAAAVPAHWSPVQNFFAVTIILALIRWVYLARQIRGLVLREEEYVLAAKLTGASNLRIILQHILPNVMFHVIVVSTLAVPQMILAETSLSFLGLGIVPPATSWGVLLQEAQNVRSLVQHPWLLIPGIFVVITVLAYNFAGDAIRDATDIQGS